MQQTGDSTSKNSGIIIGKIAVAASTTKEPWQNSNSKINPKKQQSTNDNGDGNGKDISNQEQQWQQYCGITSIKSGSSKNSGRNFGRIIATATAN